DPELSGRLVGLAGRVGAAAESGSDSALIQALLLETANVVWSDDPETQAHVAAAIVVLRAALRRAR
ncbi:MAG: hypothetical protein VW239_00285, partial [Candidatus Nanopelagicales bacterium]